MPGIATSTLLVVLAVALAIWLVRRQFGKDRFRIMASGISSLATLTEISPHPKKPEHYWVRFSFESENTKRSVHGAQRATSSAIERLGLSPGSTVQVHYLPKHPQGAFIPSLVTAERVRADDPEISRFGQGSSLPRLFYVRFEEPNNFKWFGSGDLAFEDGALRINTKRRRSFRNAANDVVDFKIDDISNVEQIADLVRFEIAPPGGVRRRASMRAINADEAEQIATKLPITKTENFIPELAEQASFHSALLRATPQAPVTPTLIGMCVIFFAITTFFGGGFLSPNGEAMIRFGTDYTPLTMSGEWWRLVTSIFLHFGLLHLAFNIWALYANGIIAERIYGSRRFFLIYLVAGVAGSLASLLWHPIVNGAGASGAIFGVLGALLAFFLRGGRGVAASVMKTHLTSISIFVAISLANAARFPGIDNAAHIGGLVGGFAMGLLLARPLGDERETHSWTTQWVMALGLVGVTAICVGQLLSNGTIAPRLAHDSNGDALPIDGMLPAPRTLGGINLGMTSLDLIAAKGQPITRDSTSLTYNALDARRDGVISAWFFMEGLPADEEYVWAVGFMGNDQEVAPTELPRLGGLNESEVIAKYGQPASREQREAFAQLWFRNGLFVAIEDDKVVSYGIFDVTTFNRITEAQQALRSAESSEIRE